MSMDAHGLTYRLGGAWRNGNGQAPCPVCQPEQRRDQKALSIDESGGNILLHCFKSGCGFQDIARAASLPMETARADTEARRKSDENRAAYEADKLAKARSLWGIAKPIRGSKAEDYLRGRGINCHLPNCLRFVPDVYHGPAATWGCAMVANVEPTGGVHRTSPRS